MKQFEIFSDGVFIYEQIRNIELEHHGKNVIRDVDADIAVGRIEVYTDSKLKLYDFYFILEIRII